MSEIIYPKQCENISCQALRAEVDEHALTVSERDRLLLTESTQKQEIKRLGNELFVLKHRAERYREALRQITAFMPGEHRGLDTCIRLAKLALSDGGKEEGGEK